MKSVISLIAAMSENRVIGINNRIPWKMPVDLEHFRNMTKGRPFIIGRNSYLSPDVLISELIICLIVHLSITGKPIKETLLSGER